VWAALLFGIIFPAPFFLHHFWNETDSYTRLSGSRISSRIFRSPGGAASADRLTLMFL